MVQTIESGRAPNAGGHPMASRVVVLGITTAHAVVASNSQAVEFRPPKFVLHFDPSVHAFLTLFDAHRIVEQQTYCGYRVCGTDAHVYSCVGRTWVRSSDKCDLKDALNDEHHHRHHMDALEFDEVENQEDDEA